jgi:diguanylate cyclase (GGDEF)-like protein
VARFFIQPDFATIVSSQPEADGTIYSGLITVGEYMGTTRSLRARIWRAAGELRLLAEYDIAELQRVNDTVLGLNHEYAKAQLDLAHINHRLQQHEAQIVASSLTDPLTGVGNRRRLEQALAAAVNYAHRTGTGLCAIMADLDHFKQVNDTYGHAAGDSVLTAFGDLLRRHTRAIDIVARFGGEEFVVLVPNTDLEHAVVIANRIRESLAACPIESLPEPVTASFGVAEMAPDEPGSGLLRRADAAMYEAKRSGRNRVASGLRHID